MAIRISPDESLIKVTALFTLALSLVAWVWLPRERLRRHHLLLK
jgi:hypothetical protein